MRQDGDRLDFIDARYGGRHGTALRRRKKDWLLIDRNEILFLWFGELQLDIPYARYFEE